MEESCQDIVELVTDICKHDLDKGSKKTDRALNLDFDVYLLVFVA